MKPPATYLSLERRGLLHHEDRSRLDPRCLWIEGVRWLDEVGPPIKLPQSSRMIPFGISANGDWWCWEVEPQSDMCSSIILSPPDTGDSTYFAPAFEAFLFRQVLQFVSNDVYCDEPDPDEIRFTVDEMHEQLEIWLDQMGQYFPERWIEVLRAIQRVKALSIHVHSPQFSYPCLFNPNRESEIVKDLLGYAHLDQRFKFNRREVDWYGE
jgi:hypothetical protein